jgi:hypothetical protein
MATWDFAAARRKRSKTRLLKDPIHASKPRGSSVLESIRGEPIAPAIACLREAVTALGAGPSRAAGRRRAIAAAARQALRSALATASSRPLGRGVQRHLQGVVAPVDRRVDRILATAQLPVARGAIRRRPVRCVTRCVGRDAAVAPYVGHIADVRESRARNRRHAHARKRPEAGRKCAGEDGRAGV